jgi:hypothetical protein
MVTRLAVEAPPAGMPDGIDVRHVTWSALGSAPDPGTAVRRGS